MVNLLSAFKVKPLPNGHPVPKETVNWRIIALALFGAGAAVLFGYDLGFIGGVITLPAFGVDFNLEDASESYKTAFHSNVVSVFQAGATVGSIALCFAADKFGRRVSLMANFILYLIGAAMMVGASGTAGVALVYTGRVLTGFSVGASTMLVPVYVAECSPPHIRGRMVGLYEVGVQFGTMVGFWIPYAILKTQKGTIQWRLPFALQLVPCGLCVIALCFLVETPRFLIRKHGEEKALKTLAFLRGLPEQHEYVQYEFTSIVEQVQWENAARSSLGTAHTIRRTFGAGNARRLLTGCLIMVFFQMAGTNAVNYYSPIIFQSFGLSAASAKLFATGVYGVVRFVSTLIAMVLFTDRFGRRSMIVAGGSLMAVCMWIIGALAYTHPPVKGDGMSGPQLASIILIFLWAVAFCFSYAGIPWIYCSEIFPLDVRTLSMGICTAVHWIFNLALAKSVPYIVNDCPPGTLYFIFAACTTVGALYEWFYMPETKGRTLEEIEEAFGGARAVTDSAERANIDKAEVGHVEEATKE